jgi:hypothetical protein
MYAILRDFMQINLYEDDFEMKADLYLRIAQGYTHAPDLRATWLEGLRFVGIGSGVVARVIIVRESVVHRRN